MDLPSLFHYTALLIREESAIKSVHVQVDFLNQVASHAVSQLASHPEIKSIGKYCQTCTQFPPLKTKLEVRYLVFCRTKNENDQE